MSIGSLFAGIGGFDIAARWLGWKTAWYSEIDPYACAVMRKHFPHAINHGDITEIDGRNIERVDILCGGFPCQDISFAGKGAGIDGEQSGLWNQYVRLIDELRPRYVVAENVSALRNRGLRKVLRDLSAVGYDAEWHCIPASELGASHQRDRIWIVAHAASVGVQRLWPEGFQVTHPLAQPLLPLRDSNGQWEVEPDLRRANDGVPRWMDRVKCVGNAIVPQVAYEIFRAIERREGR
jgi:DNA (cytosine-5)-methyltransferase 1